MWPEDARPHVTIEPTLASAFMKRGPSFAANVITIIFLGQAFLLALAKYRPTGRALVLKMLFVP
jgi:hypothetical protein